MATLDDMFSAAAKCSAPRLSCRKVRDIPRSRHPQGSLYHHIREQEELLYLVVKEPIAQMYRAILEIPPPNWVGREARRRFRSPEAFDRLSPPGLSISGGGGSEARFREMIGSHQEYYRCYNRSCGGVEKASSARSLTFKSPRTGSWEC